mmetsp:Transcript_16512/g.27473  ORF Transcript_16512/g.27473 Transcript_16512/m.27473 type:complete len:83 (+) Transcript_16512:15-263(+)
MNATLSLYRDILRTARRWPSKNRKRIIEEIRSDFRAHKYESDPTKLKVMLEEARIGLASLRMQVAELGDPAQTSIQYQFGQK